MRDEEPPRIGLFLEQIPNRESRVLLSDERDAIGLRRLILDWRVTERDWGSFERTAAIMVDALAEARFLGAFDPVVLRRRDPAAILHSNHHLGTTRMSADPAQGVVDPDCRVYGMSNLYIAGGGVFTTGSWANPTFTLTCLVLRLADHLLSRHKQS
jgi:choline dehydrogenase-like flavoprotein